MSFEPPLEEITKGFTVPDCTGFDAESYLKAIPPRATIRGLFFNNLVEQCGGPKASGIKLRIGFKNYPATEFVESAVTLAKVAFPSEAIGDGIRLLGQGAFTGFSSSIIGRSLLASMVSGFHDVLQLAPRAYSLAGSMATAEYLPMGPEAACIELRNCFDIPQCHEVGVFQGLLTAHDLTGDVLIRPFSEGDADLLIRWKPQ